MKDGKYLYSFCFLALLAGCPATADVATKSDIETLLSEDKVKVFWSAPPGALPKDVEHKIAELATPEFVVVEAGSTFRSAIQAACPGSGAGYFTAVEQLNPSFSEILGRLPLALDDVATTTEVRFRPACIGSAFQDVTIREGSSSWDIFDRARASNEVIKRTDWADFQQVIRSANSLNNLDGLQRDQILKVPPSALTITVPMSNSITLINVLKASGLGGEIALRMYPKLGQVDGTVIFDNSCKPSGLEDVLSYEVSQYGEIIESVLSSVKAADNLKPSTVIVADSGMRRIKHGMMEMLSRHAISSSEAYRKNVYQLPKDHAKDFNLSCFSGPARDHAEGVLGVAMGGFNTSLSNSVYSPIKIFVHNTFTELFPNFKEDGSFCLEIQSTATDLAAMLADLGPNSVSVDVVNLSQSWPEDEVTRPLEKLATSQSASFLLVAAAGNHGNNLKDKPAYPSSYGAGDNTRLAVVAAVDREGQLLPTSNFNNELVDVAANGCNVPSIRFTESEIEDESGFRMGQLEQGFYSGTSFAAPRVSFAAAMIKYLAGDNIVNPVRLKQRIIYSSDIDGNLFKFVRDGRILNVAKALSLYEDVISVEDLEVGSAYTSYLLRGDVQIGDGIGQVQVCPTWSINGNSLLKIAKVSGGDRDGQYLIYYREGDLMKRRFCNSISDIHFKQRDSELTQGLDHVFPGRIIKDIVFREFQ